MRARDLRILVALSLAISAGGSCATTPGNGPVAPGNAEVRVEVYQGLQPGTIPEPQLDVLIDVTPLLGSDEVPGRDTDLTPLAESYAGRIASLLPAGQAQTRYHGFHRIASSDSAESACPEPNRESFAVRALDALREKLAASGAQGRVVLVSDVSAECTPLLCQAAQRLAASGTWLDLVQIGPGAPPSCIAELKISPAETPAFLTTQARAPGFRIETLESASGPRSVLAKGQAQGDPVAVAPGLRMIVVELSPEEQIGPVLLQDRQRTRVRLMDFPLSAPGRREWVVEVER